MSVTKDRVVKTGVRRWIRMIALVTSGLLACGLLASSVEADQNGSTPNFGIPPNADYYNPVENSVVNAWRSNFSEVQTNVTKAKQTVKLTDLKTLTYAKFCVFLDFGYGFTLQTCCPDPFDTGTCPEDSIVRVPAFNDDFENSGNISWTQVKGPTWTISPPGASTVYGQFVPLRVRMVGFGSIPVTATVHLTQTKHGGLFDPMDIYYATFTGGDIPKDASLDGYGSPSASLPLGVAFDMPARVTGTVDLRISDVIVDGVRLEVGPECRTSKPAELELKQAAGFYDVNSDPNDRNLNPLGTAGAWRPLGDKTVTTFVPGTIAIPAFSGCQRGSENLDPLLTGLVSGAQNEVIAGQRGSIDVCNTPPDGTISEGTNPSYNCPPFPVVEPAVPLARSAAPRAQAAAKPEAAAKGIAPKAKLKAEARPEASPTSSKTLRAIAKLTPKQLDNASKQIASLSPKIRKQVMASLPPELVQAMKK